MKYSKTELDRARRALGIKLPVVVRVNRGPLPDGMIMGPGGAAGVYDAKPFTEGAGEHRIDLAPGQPRAMANNTLAHELVHARQQELCADNGLDGVVAYSMADRIAGYAENPFEVQAREWQDDIAAEFDIVRTDT